jgi:precorrin-6A synthase
MRKILIIGIGAGDPDYLTFQAVKALNAADIVFIPDKGTEKARLRRLRVDICDRFLTNKAVRFVEMRMPERRTDGDDYKSSVGDWHAEIEAMYEALFAAELREGMCGAFLVWGDPTLYDSTLRIIARIKEKGRIAIDYDVIPGISAVQALAAKHRIALNRIGEPVHLTTGRKLAEALPEGSGDIVVLLDGVQAFKRHVDTPLEIYWGAYLGMEEEVLAAGKLSDVAEEIATLREAARQKNGWIMDVYLLRKPGNDP